MIVKIQRALSGSPSILVYDKPTWRDGSEVHEIFAQIEMTEQEIVAILGEDLKGYFETELEDGSIVTDKRLPDEDW